ncbi:sigma-70 family RNA polymerase sigma factor [Sorangium sp. So ce291]|uniref:RNA polymerase sigma factor n=1 Tax=Sorangium sp. So ce291 TaxID=3133294 RepID=UPI003F613B1B
MGEPGSTPTGFEFFRRLARRLGVPARHAEDLAQDALLRGLEADLRVELGEARASYGATIVLNQARNHVRNARRRGEVLTSFDDHELPAECPTPEEMLRRHQREALLRDLINQVDPRSAVHAPAPAPAVVEENAPPLAQRSMPTTAAVAAQETEQPTQDRDARGSAPSAAPVRRTSLPVRAVVPAVSKREQSLIAEARRAIEDHNAVADAEARRLLETHAREFAQGQLAAEREALLAQIR